MKGKLVLTRETLRILTGVQLRAIMTGDGGSGEFTRYSDNDCGTTFSTILSIGPESCNTCEGTCDSPVKPPSARCGSR